MIQHEHGVAGWQRCLSEPSLEDRIADVADGVRCLVRDLKPGQSITITRNADDALNLVTVEFRDSLYPRN